METKKLEERFMVQWIYADDTQDVTTYMSREEMINRFNQAFPFVKNERFESARVTIDITTVNIVHLY